ncbi:hypothetical protein ACOV11_14555 [Vibrio natriegens]
MEPNGIITLVVSVIGCLAICLYYMDKDKSVCCECKKSISHQKVNRYYFERDGEKLALCKQCYNRSIKQASLKAQECSCCGKSFTTRMKILEWNGKDRTYFLCVTCNGKAIKMVTHHFVLDDVFPSEFIQSCSHFENLNSLVSASNLKLTSQDDFNSSSWDKFVVENTSFSSWSEMKDEAERELLKKQNDNIVAKLSSSYQ